MVTVAQDNLTPKNTLIVEWFLDDFNALAKSLRGREVMRNDVQALLRRNGSFDSRLAAEMEAFVWVKLRDLLKSKAEVIALTVQQQNVPDWKPDYGP